MQCAGSPAKLRSQCRNFYLNYVNYTDERQDLLAASRRGRLSHEEYLAMTTSHKFCLVAPGDFVSTHKITEAMAVGGSGGCIPVFVLRTLPCALTSYACLRRQETIPAATAAGGMLPYTRWLDYCSVAYLVEEKDVLSDAQGMVRELLRVTEAEARSKLDALRRVRDAFVFRDGSTPSRPSAAEHILDEACSAAKEYTLRGGAAREEGERAHKLFRRRQAGVASVQASRPGEYDLNRCMLLRRK